MPITERRGDAGPKDATEDGSGDAGTAVTRDGVDAVEDGVITDALLAHADEIFEEFGEGAAGFEVTG